MINTFLECPQKFKQMYLSGDHEDKTSLDLKFGSAMHLALKTHFEDGDPFSVFNMYWNMVKAEHLEAGRFNWDDLHKLANDTFLPNFIRLHSKHFKNPVLEQTLTMPILGEHTLQGTFDVVAEIDGVLTLCDYKTSGREYPQYKIMRNPQLYIYAALYKHNYGVLPKQVMYKVFIKQEKRIQTQRYPLTEEKLKNMMDNVEAICKDIVTRTNWYCNYSSCLCGTPKECFR